MFQPFQKPEQPEKILSDTKTSPAKTQLRRAWGTGKERPSPFPETGVSDSVKRQGHLSVLCDVKMLDDALLLQFQQGL